MNDSLTVELDLLEAAVTELDLVEAYKSRLALRIADAKAGRSTTMADRYLTIRGRAIMAIVHARKAWVHQFSSTVRVDAPSEATAPGSGVADASSSGQPGGGGVSSWHLRFPCGREAMGVGTSLRQMAEARHDHTCTICPGGRN